MRIFNTLRRPRLDWAQTTDQGLLSAVAQGDMTAFEELHGRYFSKLMRFAFRIVDNTDTAEEVANDTLMIVWRTADRFEGRSKPSTWMFGIAYRTAQKARQKTARRMEDAMLEDSLTGAEGVEDDVVQRTDLANALKQLTPEMRAVVELTYFNGYVYTEIAQILECPVGTVKTRMMTARKHLRALLAGDGALGKVHAHG